MIRCKFTGGVLVNENGTVRSCQPDGTWQVRPPGTAGAYEICTVNGAIVAYTPGVAVYAFAFVEKLSDGWSAVGEQPL